MKHYFYYNKGDGVKRLAMFSEKQIAVDKTKMAEVLIDIAATDLEKLRDGENLEPRIENNLLTFTPRPERAKMIDLRQRLQTATTLAQMKSIFIDLLT